MKKKGTKVVAVGDLTLDHEVYPRKDVWPGNVKHLMGALSAGAVLPPIEAEAGTLIIADGANRRDAYIKLYGPEHRVKVVLYEFESREELRAYAARVNDAHGQRLSDIDRRRNITWLMERGWDLERIAESLQLTKDTIDDILTRTAIAQGGKIVPLKRQLENLKGKKLTAEQESANERAGAHTQFWLLNQVLILAEARVFDLGNPKVAGALLKLHGFLTPLVEEILENIEVEDLAEEA